MFWKTNHRVISIAILIAFIASNIVFVTPAMARDNRQAIKDELTQEGWTLISVYHLDHAAYLRLIATSLSGGMAGELAAQYAKLYAELYDLRGDATLAKSILDTLISSLKGGNSSSVNVGNYDIAAKILTYRHWHDEKLPYCTWKKCGWRWIEIPEPNTHELVILMRPKVNQGRHWKSVVVDARIGAWQADVILEPNRTYRIRPSASDTYTMNNGQTLETYAGSGRMDGYQLDIPANPISLGGLTVLVWHHKAGAAIPQILSFFPGTGHLDVSVGNQGGSMRFIIGDIKGTYGDNSGTLSVDIMDLSR